MIKKILLGLLGLILLITIGGYAYYRLAIYEAPKISEEDRQAIPLMPLPNELVLNTGSFTIDEQLSIQFEAHKGAFLEDASSRFLNRLSALTNLNFKNTSTNNSNFKINCKEGFKEEVQQLEEDESYNLLVSNNQIQLNANAPLGVLRGLETLLQLTETADGQFFFPAIEINDAPRFPWRGIMIDVSRHWIPKEAIIRNISAMAAVKLNVLHLHLSDDQGFRVESKVFPKLHELGSNGKYFTQEDIKEIVDHAKARGIRIVPEFDVPGHTKSWLIAYPELASAEGPFKFGRGEGSLFSVPMDPTNEAVYTFLDALIEEMTGLFPDPYFHIGGDEVNPEPWNNNPEIQAFMEENNLEDAHDLHAYFNKRLNAIVKKHDRIMMGWEEVLHPDLDKNIVVQSWKGHKTLFEAAQHGSQAILSAGYYLDHKLHSSRHYGIDPMILPGAVDIEIDSNQWTMYDLEMDIPTGKMESQMILFDKDPQNVRGFFAMLDQRNAFKNGKIENGQMSFDFNTAVGDINFSADMIGDSINGNIALGLLKFPAVGSKSGGTGTNGKPMPKIEIMKPLTEEEKTRIIGGEACMWSEVVSGENIDSRLWPRSAAIAERFWTNADLLNDEDDMYRRLEYVNQHLANQGALHEVNYNKMLEEFAGENPVEPLKNLVDILEEVKYYNRLSQLIDIPGIYLPDFPLDSIADLAKPESLHARAFNKLVDSFIENPQNQEVETQILGILDLWKKNHLELESIFESNPKVQVVEDLSFALHHISRLAIGSIHEFKDGEELNQVEKKRIEEALQYLENGTHGVQVAVYPGLRRLFFELDYLKG